MNILRLGSQPVIIEGADYFGRHSKIIFRNVPNGNGFFWKYAPDKPSVCISIEMLATKMRRTVLQYEESSLNLY